MAQSPCARARRVPPPPVAVGAARAGLVLWRSMLFWAHHPVACLPESHQLLKITLTQEAAAVSSRPASSRTAEYSLQAALEGGRGEVVESPGVCRCHPYGLCSRPGLPACHIMRWTAALQPRPALFPGEEAVQRTSSTHQRCAAMCPGHTPARPPLAPACVPAWPPAMQSRAARCSAPCPWRRGILRRPPRRTTTRCTAGPSPPPSPRPWPSSAWSAWRRRSGRGRHSMPSRSSGSGGTSSRHSSGAGLRV